MGWVRKRGFAPFAMYRIVLGIAVTSARPILSMRRARCPSRRRPSTRSRTTTTSPRSRPAWRSRGRGRRSPTIPPHPTFDNTIVAAGEERPAARPRARQDLQRRDRREHQPHAAEGAGRSRPPKLAAHQDAFPQQKLFARVAAIYKQRARSISMRSRCAWWSATTTRFRACRANLSEADKTKLKS
jgi:hypothetical protein